MKITFSFQIFYIFTSIPQSDGIEVENEQKAFILPNLKNAQCGPDLIKVHTFQDYRYLFFR